MNFDSENYTQIEITVCLPCADGDCLTCYGEGCECRCRGEESGELPPAEERAVVRIPKPKRQR